MDEMKIVRINELYRKSKAEGLTLKEKREQDLLRKEYIAQVRSNLRGQLDNIDIKNPDGTVESLSEKQKKREAN